MFHTARAVALAASCAGLLLAGCSGSVHNGTIDKTVLAQNISDQLTKELGGAPDSVACPGPLKAQVGQSEQCTEVDHGLPYHVTATITSIQFGNPQYKLLVN